MKDFEKIIPSAGNRHIVLTNRLSDPSMWIISVYKKILFFKRKVMSYWFNSREEAEEFALRFAKTN